MAKIKITRVTILPRRAKNVEEEITEVVETDLKEIETESETESDDDASNGAISRAGKLYGHAREAHALSQKEVAEYAESQGITMAEARERVAVERGKSVSRTFTVMLREETPRMSKEERRRLRLGPGRRQEREAFWEDVKEAIRRLKKQGKRVTQDAVAETLRCDARAIRERQKRYGLSWRQVRDMCE